MRSRWARCIHTTLSSQAESLSSQPTVETVRNGVEVIAEEARIDVEGHSGGGVPKHQLHRFNVGAGGYSKAGCVWHNSCASVGPG
jgi:hypothetical protein